PRILAEYQARFPGRFRLRIAAKNQGVAANFLGAFNDCEDGYVAILEGDDSWISPDKLRLQADAMDANARATLCGTNALVRDERQAGMTQIHPGHNRAYLSGVESILASNFFSTCTMMVRKRGTLAVPPQLQPVWGDWALKLHFAMAGDTLFLPQQTGCYRVSGSGAWSSLNPAQQECEVLRVLRAFLDYVGPSYAHILGPRIRRQLVLVGNAWRALGDEARAQASRRELAELPADTIGRPPAPHRPVAGVRGMA
ncbi:MAG: glycosyltransferase, partial [Candidatus Eiseniibacteriota bacterium]